MDSPFKGANDIFQTKEPFEEAYHPEEILERDEEIKTFAAALQDVLIRPTKSSPTSPTNSTQKRRSSKVITQIHSGIVSIPRSTNLGEYSQYLTKHPRLAVSAA